MAAEEIPHVPDAVPAALEGAHAGTAAAEHGGGGGLPQFEFQYWGGQIVWLLLIFIVLYTLMSRVFIPRLRRVQDTRAQTIASAVAEARRVQDEADAQAAAARAEIDQARTRARTVAAEAKAKANAEFAARQAEADARIAEEVAAAETRIRGLRDSAMASVGDIAVETAGAMVQRLTGTAASAADLRAAIKGAA
jgi:F-type H+-transporting ATPase subunit b